MGLIRSIDINCDVGEGYSTDAEIMPFISSCNIACGGHFGDRESMRMTIQLAKKYQVKIGAHPSYPDKENFGRKIIDLPEEELIENIQFQITEFLSVCAEENVKPHHLKLHGALYNRAAEDEKTTKLVLSALDPLNLDLKLVAPEKSILAEFAIKKYELIPEAFMDRSYEDDGSLRARNLPNALIESPEIVWEQLKQIYLNKTVKTITGNDISLTAKTFCLHGDAPNALPIIHFVNNRLSELEIELEKNA